MNGAVSKGTAFFFARTITAPKWFLGVPTHYIVEKPYALMAYLAKFDR